MTVTMSLVLAFSLAGPPNASLAPAPRTQAAQAPQGAMTTYYLVLLKKAPTRSEPPAAADADIQKQHIAHLEKLGADGFGMAAGPMGDDGELRGLVVIKAASAQQARELSEQDPAVKAGRLVVEILAFMSPEGWFNKPAQPFAMEQLYFGFLTRAKQPAAHDAETIKRLQSDHLAYMDARHKEGKLVMAGPIIDGGDRRGLVVYRVPTLTDARAIAEADPMVKAGRLAVELHPWYLPKGVIK